MLKLHINSFGLNLNFYLFYVIWWSTQKVSLIVVTISNFLSSEQSPFFTSISELGETTQCEIKGN